MHDLLGRLRVEMSFHEPKDGGIEQDGFVILAQIEGRLEILSARAFCPAHDEGVGVRRRLRKLKFVVVDGVGGQILGSLGEEGEVVKSERIAVDGRPALRTRNDDVNLAEIGFGCGVE